jgi:hypothetical protein
MPTTAGHQEEREKMTNTMTNTISQYDAAVAAVQAANRLPADSIFPAPKLGESKAAKVTAAKAALAAATLELETCLQWVTTGDTATDPASIRELAPEYLHLWAGAAALHKDGKRVFRRAIRAEGPAASIAVDPARNDPHAWAGSTGRDTASRLSVVQIAAI